MRARTSLGTLAPVSATDSSQCELRERGGDRQELFSELDIAARGGLAPFCLISSAQPGEALLQATVNGDAGHVASTTVRFDAAVRSPVFVA